VPLLALTTLFLLAALCMGTVTIGPTRALRWLVSFAHLGQAPGPAWEGRILLSLRAPRFAVGFLAGGALAASGVAMQGLLRNPLADPGILGSGSGAATGAALAFFLGVGANDSSALALFAAGGAALATGLVLLSHRKGSVQLILTGVALSALFSAITSFFISTTFEEWDKGRQIAEWMLGSLDGKSLADAKHLVLPVLFGVCILQAQARRLDALLLGEEEAISLGVNVTRLTRRIVLAGSLLVGATVATCGIIGFVGLIAPHFARRFVGASHKHLLWLSFWLGGLLVVLCDLLARILIAPRELHLGVLTAAVGGPLLLVILRARSKGGAP
jgi:iron complex transport system permease protein